jgi:signal transduction histidine kinase
MSADGTAAATSRPGWLRDAGLAAGVVALDLLLFSTLLNGEGPTAIQAAAVIGYSVLGGVALALRRRAPVLVYAAVWAHAAVALALPGYRPTLVLLVALYTVAAHQSLRLSLLALLATVVPIAAAVADGVSEAAPDERLSTVVGIASLLAVVHAGAFGIGRWVRASRDRAAALERRRDDAARAAVDGERARIAGELHDVVASSVTIMTLQAAGAQKVLRQDPERAERALAEVGGVGTRAVAELRHLLTTLRPAGPGVGDLDELLATVRAAGVAVDLVRSGVPGMLRPDADLAAYRVVQEALTNVARHAGSGVPASVSLCWEPAGLRVEVSDGGPGQPSTVASPRAAGLSTGNGLRGLAERVGAAGGRLEHGPGPAGGFRVVAFLPVHDPAAAR